MGEYLLALDQGTTSSRSIVFDRAGNVVATAQQEFEQILPRPGHVEHDPAAIWQTQLATAKQAIVKARVAADNIAAIGVTNQRETTILWERDTGKPVANAIVWQSRVSSPICEQLKRDGCEQSIREKTGLVCDAYFSGTKIKHLLDTTPGLRDRAANGDICFGTVDTWLIYQLTAGRVHATDVSNASRTLLFNIHTMQWDDDLLTMLDIPRAMLPQVKSSSELFGETEASLLGEAIPIAGVAGDQQAATFGQCCFEKGTAKNTYGTGCFLLMNTGEQAVTSQNQLLTTVGWKINDRVTYCLEGSVFIAGAVVQWLRDGLGIIKQSTDIEALAGQCNDSDGVYFVPAFVGLGAPYWDSYARGTIIGLTRGTKASHIARAAVESMAFQSRDVIDAMNRDAGIALKTLKVDGGACVNNELMQFQSDLLNTTVQRPVVNETTALGAAYLAGLAVGFYKDLDDIRRNWQLDRAFVPAMDDAQREQRYAMWRKAVERSMQWAQE